MYNYDNKVSADIKGGDLENPCEEGRKRGENVWDTKAQLEFRCSQSALSYPYSSEVCMQQFPAFSFHLLSPAELIFQSIGLFANHPFSRPFYSENFQHT